jgi:hypothetical protein
MIPRHDYIRLPKQMFMVMTPLLQTVCPHAMI